MTTVDGNLRGYPTTKVKICKVCKDFLENPFLLFGMKIDQANTVFEVTKTSLYAPSAGVEIFYSQLKQEQDKRASKKVLQLGSTFLRCFLT